MVKESNKINTIPESKKLDVKNLKEKFSNSKTVLIASTKGLPSSQFNEIKKKLRGKVEIKISKKSLVLRALRDVEKGAIQNLKQKIGADVAIFFSELDAFELSSLLNENQSSSKARAGDIAPEDIEIQEGITELMPGPDISALSGVGLKVAVENGKIAIKKGAKVVKKGEEISGEVANVLGKLSLTPMKVGFIPIAAYDSVSDNVYFEIKIDKEATLEELRESIGKAFGFAVNVEYICPESAGILIGKAGAEERALGALVKSDDDVKKDGEQKGDDDNKDEERKVNMGKSESEDSGDIAESGDSSKAKVEDEKAEKIEENKGGEVNKEGEKNE